MSESTKIETENDEIIVTVDDCYSFTYRTDGEGCLIEVRNAYPDKYDHEMVSRKRAKALTALENSGQFKMRLTHAIAREFRAR